MKLLSLIFSLVTLIVLSLSTLSETKNTELANNSEMDINFKVPLKLPKTLLPAEIKWKELLAEKNTEKKSTKADESEFINALKIGEHNYKLFGVFNNEQSLFVLLRNSDSKRLKLSLGDKLPGGFTLTDINNNTIVFSHHNERIEYKLFEPKNYVKK